MSKSTRLVVLALAVVLVLSMAAFAAGELMLNGEAKFTLKYDGTTGTLGANTILNFKGSLKGTAVSINFGDDTANGFYKSINFWGNWPTTDGYKFSPYYITANVRGAYYQNGPKVTTTLGDFNYPVPKYVAGQFHRVRGVGAMVTDYPIIDKVTLTGFFAWPKYGAGFTLRGELPNLFYNQGFVLKANNVIPGLSLQAYALNHMHQDGTHLLYGAGLKSKKAFSAINGARTGDTLILYTPGFVKDTNPWGSEALIGPDGTVIEKATRVLYDAATNTHAPVPAGHYVLSGHGVGDQFIQNSLTVGDKVKINLFEKPTTTIAETTYGLEASGALAGVNMSGKFLYRNTWDNTTAESKKDNQYVALTDADYTFNLASIKTKVNAGFRYIDKDFKPFARETDTNPNNSTYNPIEAKLGQLGGNAGLNFTLPASTTLTLSGDYYNKEISADAKDADGNPINDADGKNIVVVGQYDRMTGTVTVTNSALYGVTASVSATGTRGVNAYPVDKIPAGATLVPETIANSVTTKASLAKDWTIPTKDKISTTYTLSTSNLLGKKANEIAFTNKLEAKTTLTLPVVNKVGLEGTATFVTLADITIPTYVGKLTHTLPNGFALEAKATKVSKAKTVWYTQLVWSASW